MLNEYPVTFLIYKYTPKILSSETFGLCGGQIMLFTVCKNGFNKISQRMVNSLILVAVRTPIKDYIGFLTLTIVKSNVRSLI